jgi:hypothetical protein
LSKVGTPKFAERIASVETRLNVFLDEQFPEFQHTITAGFADLAERIDAASLNGQTPRVKHISQMLGDPEDVTDLRDMIDTRRRWKWALSPFHSAASQLRNAFFWGGGALVLAWLHAIVKAAYPHAPIP